MKLIDNNLIKLIEFAYTSRSTGKIGKKFESVNKHGVQLWFNYNGGRSFYVEYEPQRHD